MRRQGEGVGGCIKKVGKIRGQTRGFSERKTEKRPHHWEKRGGLTRPAGTGFLSRTWEGGKKEKHPKNIWIAYSERALYGESLQKSSKVV